MNTRGSSLGRRLKTITSALLGAAWLMIQCSFPSNRLLKSDPGTVFLLETKISTRADARILEGRTVTVSRLMLSLESFSCPHGIPFLFIIDGRVEETEEGSWKPVLNPDHILSAQCSFSYYKGLTGDQDVLNRREEEPKFDGRWTADDIKPVWLLPSRLKRLTPRNADRSELTFRSLLVSCDLMVRS